MPRILGKEVPRSALVVLLFAGLSTLSSGTNYVVGSWAPQMADAVGLSSTDINLVAACGNFGVYLTGPLWGLYADTRGARTLLLVGAALLGFGYGGLALSYSAGAKLWMLALYSFCTGLGSCAGNTAGLNAVARCFTPETRGLAFGIVVAAYGLSAFFYASISGYIVGDNTLAFLVILALGTSSSLFVSGLFLTQDRVMDAYSALPTSSTGDTPGGSSQPMFRAMSRLSGEEEDDHDIEDAELLNSPTSTHGHSNKTDIGGISLLKVPDYYLLMVVTFCLTGTGLMWINSVGTVVVTLARYNQTVGKITRLQSHQTSLLSIFNCLGRLFIGTASDHARSRAGLKPIWWLVFLSGTFLLSQAVARAAGDLHSLSWATSLVGFSYGQFYGLAPLILLEWFGLTYFSSNVGMLYMVPTVSSYAFSHLFGAIYDSHVDTSPAALAQAALALASTAVPGAVQGSGNGIGGSGHTHVCGDGAECYAPVFGYTMAACAAAGAISVLLGMRRGARTGPSKGGDGGRAEDGGDESSASLGSSRGHVQ